MEDLIIKCIDCQKDFVFSVGEQKFFKEKGLFTPKRCPYCRGLKKAERREVEDEESKDSSVHQRHSESEVEIPGSSEEN